MGTVNFIASIATILSFLISLFVLNKVIKIDKSINVKKSKKNNQKIKGDNNVLSGKNTNVTK
jgi:hypothetical protein